MAELPWKSGIGPEPMGMRDALVLGVGPGDLVSALGGFATRPLLERRHRVAVVLNADEPVGDPARDLERLGSECRHVDGRGLVRESVDACRVHLMVPAVPGDHFSGPQLPDQLHRLLNGALVPPRAPACDRSNGDGGGAADAV